MAKQLFFDRIPATIHRGTKDAGLSGSLLWWSPFLLSEVRGLSDRSLQATTVVGPTNGIEVVDNAPASLPSVEWISEPLSADFTIAGTITFNLWASEATMNDNAAVNAVIEKMDGATGVLTQIVKTARVTEVALTTATVNNFTATPTSTVCKRGDRLRVRVFADDAGTMAATGSMTFNFSGITVGGSFDSWIQFTENLTFEPATLTPAQTVLDGTTVFGSTSLQQAQPFTAASQRLDQVQIWMALTGSPTDSVVVEVQSDSAGPSGTVVGTVGTVAAASLTAAQAQFTFATSIPVTSGAKYWLVFRRVGGIDTTNYFRIGSAVAGPFPGWPIGWILPVSTGVWAQFGNTNVFTVSLAFGSSTYYLTDTAEATAVGQLQFVPGANPGLLSMGSAAGTARVAQSFVAPTGATALREIGAWLSKVAAPTDDMIVELQSDSSGSPSGTVLSTLATISGASLTTTPTLYRWATTQAVTAGATYWIVLRRSGAVDAVNYFRWSTPSAPFTVYGSSKNYNGSTWAASGLSQAFSVACNAAFNTTRKALTTRGSGSVNAVTNTIGGPVNGIPVTSSAGGPLLEWYTPALEAVTLGGKAKFNIRALESNAAAEASLALEIAVCEGDGTGPVVWGKACLAPGFSTYGELATTDGSYTAWVSGDDVAVAAGQRLRFRAYVEDTAIAQLVGPLTVTVSYNGATIGAAGDSYVTLPVTVVEQATGPQTRFGVVAVALTDTVVTAGSKQTFGSAALSLTNNRVTNGVRKAVGVASVALVDTVTTSGVVKKIGAVAVALVNTRVTSATRKTFSTLSLPLVVGRVTAAKATFKAALAVALVVSRVTAAVRVARGASATALVDTITTNGTATAGSTTYFGTVAVGLTDTVTTSATRKTLAASAVALTNARVTSATRKTFSAAAVALVDTVTTNATRKTSATVAVALVNVRVTAARVTMKSGFAVALVDTIVVSATRKTVAVVAVSLVNARVTAAKVTFKGVTSTPLVVAVGTNATRRAMAAVAVLLTNVRTTAAKILARSSTATSETVGVLTNGQISGTTVTHFGTATVSLTNVRVTNATRKTFSATSVPLVNTRVTAARVTFKGITSTPLVVSRTTNALRTAMASTAVSLVNARVTAAKVTFKGSPGVRMETVAITTSAVVFSHPTYFGTSVVALTDVRVTAAKVTAKSALQVGLVTSVTTGARRTLKTSTATALVVSVTTRGNAMVGGITVLNLADNIYLGESPASAVYVGSTKVWP